METLARIIALFVVCWGSDAFPWTNVTTDDVTTTGTQVTHPAQFPEMEKPQVTQMLSITVNKDGQLLCSSLGLAEVETVKLKKGVYGVRFDGPKIKWEDRGTPMVYFQLYHAFYKHLDQDIPSSALLLSVNPKAMRYYILDQQQKLINAKVNILIIWP